MFVFFKFIVAGFLGVSVNFSFTYFFKEILRIHKYLSNTVSLLLALIVNFFLNRLWTFEAYGEDIQLQILKFFLIVLFSILINHIIVYFCHSKFLLNFYASKVIAVILVFFWNYIMHLNFTFNI